MPDGCKGCSKCDASLLGGLPSPRRVIRAKVYKDKPNTASARALFRYEVLCSVALSAVWADCRGLGGRVRRVKTGQNGLNIWNWILVIGDCRFLFCVPFAGGCHKVFLLPPKRCLCWVHVSIPWFIPMTTGDTKQHISGGPLFLILILHPFPGIWYVATVVVKKNRHADELVSVGKQNVTNSAWKKGLSVRATPPRRLWRLQHTLHRALGIVRTMNKTGNSLLLYSLLLPTPPLYTVQYVPWGPFFLF